MEETKYISFLGYDYTEYVKTEEDIADFKELCRREEASKGVALKICINDVAECLRLDRKLRGKGKNVGKVLVQGNIKEN